MDGLRLEKEEESIKFFNNPDFVHFVGALRLPGVRLCFARLEHEYFPPGTESNKNEFFVRLADWGNILWEIVSIPKEKKELIERIAPETGLRITDGVPTILRDGTIYVFPFSNERVFTLENITGQPHKKTLDELAEMLEAETREIERIIYQSPN